MQAKSLVAAMFLATTLSPQIAFSQEAPQKAPGESNLAKPFQMTNGDMVAQIIERTIRMTNRWDSPNFITMYDRRMNKVGILWRGDQTTAEEAKKILEQLRALINGEARQLAKGTYGIDFPVDGFIIKYENKRTTKDILMFSEGRYELP